MFHSLRTLAFFIAASQEFDVFEKPKYIRNSLNVVFPQQLDIRRRANEFEDKLKGQYVQPQIIPVPDDLDPNVPRLIFGSKRGFSQIIISQNNLMLNVTYSPDWQVDISKGRQYLLERVPILFDLLEMLEEREPYFCGLTTVVRLPAGKDVNTTLKYMADLLLGDLDAQGLHDIRLKTTTVILDQFFSNITLRNYHVWGVEGNQQRILRLSRKKVIEQGIEIEGDFNDRYSFNEAEDYLSSQDVAKKIIDRAFAEMSKEIERVMKGSRS